MTEGTDSKILKRLEEWEEKEGPLPKSLEFYRGLLGIQSEAKLHIGAPRISLSPEMISNRVIAGHPLLDFDNLSVDWSLLRDVFEEIRALFSNYSEVWAEIPENLKDASSSLDFLKGVTKTWFEEAQLPSWIVTSDANKALLESMILAALKPFLTGHQEALHGLINQELWRRGYCPICGGSPDFAFLDKERGARWLLCSRCDAEWLFKRLECPCCGTQDQDALAYFTDDKGLYRLYVCEQCRRYLKAIDLRQADGEVLMPLERFLTLDIDTQAQKDGYIPLSKVRGREEIAEHGATLFSPEKGKKLE